MVVVFIPPHIFEIVHAEASVTHAVEDLSKE